MCVHCYKLASDEGRHKILSLLSKKPRTVSELTERLHVKQPTVTHHLKRLADAGLVRMKKEGRTHRYALAKESECFNECGLLAGLK
jgi:DNA-binding transcriptional ArsR family regulator